MTSIEDMLAQRPADEQNIAVHKKRMESELAAEQADAEKHIWRHSDWD